GTARARFGTTFIREADSRQFSAEFGLTPEDSLLLVGDPGAPFVESSGAERVVFDPEAPYAQYRRELRPSAGGGVDTVYVVLTSAPADTVAVYRVRFSRVGPGQGDYVREGPQSGGVVVNGIVYTYVGE